MLLNKKPFLVYNQYNFLAPLISLISRFSISWMCLMKSAFFFPSKLVHSSVGKGIKSKEVNALKPYTISKRANLVAKCTLLLYANSTCGKHSSHVFSSFVLQQAIKQIKSFLLVNHGSAQRPKDYGFCFQGKAGHKKGLVCQKQKSCSFANEAQNQ